MAVKKYYFRLSQDAGISKDEDGKPADAFMSVEIGGPEENVSWEEARKRTAQILDVEARFLHPASRMECQAAGVA